MTTDDEEDNSVSENIMYEQEVGRYSIETYTTFANQVTSIINKTKSAIEDYTKRGYLIIGYGAAAKGNTFLNASMIKPHFIIDDNELKYHTLTPGSNSIVVNSEFIELCANNVLFVPLSWNFYEEITQKIQNKLKTLTFSSNFSYEILRYYPNFIIEKIEQNGT